MFALALVMLGRQLLEGGQEAGYIELTLTCVKCHKHVREVRMGRLPPLPRHSLLGQR